MDKENRTQIVKLLFRGFLDKSKIYRYNCPSRSITIVESINAKFFENGDFSGRIKVREITSKCI